MNILVFSPEPSHPQHLGNRKRIFTLAKYMQSKGHRIHFVYFTQNGLNRKFFNLMQDEWDTFTFIEMQNPIQYRTGNYGLDEWYQDDIQSIINQIIKDFDIKMVLINYLMQSKFLEFIPSGVLKVIDTHDIFADRYKLYEENDAPGYKWYSISKEDEIKGLNRADIILAIQEEEAAYFSSVTEKPVMTIKHLEIKHFLDRNYNSLKKIGFIGSGNGINVHSIQAFLREFIQSDLSKNIQVVLAGQVCTCIDVEHECITRRGIVDDLEDFYNEVDLVINPLTFGTGLKIKSVEALSYGVPIISTKVGFEGIKSKHICHQINTLEEMVECIDTIHKSPAKLFKLEKLSKTIFDTYETKVKRKIQKLFKTKKLDKVPAEQDIHQSLKKKESILYQQHKQIQIDAFNKKEYEKKIEQQQDQINNFEKAEKQQQALMDLIREVTKLSLVRHPFKKYKAYKSMLKTYFNIRRIQK